MIEVISKVPIFKTYYATGHPKILPVSITVNVSPICNLTCKTCNIWKKRENELSLEEWKKVFQSMGKSPYWVTFTGGEPFLRKDLVEIVKAFYDSCEPKIVNIPTNGVLYPVIAKKVKEVAEHCKNATVIMNISLDGVKERHDEIRGMKGCFDMAVKTLNSLKELKKECKNLEVGVHTVISKFNVLEVPKIFEYIHSELKPDSFISEIAEERHELDTIGMDITPSLEEYSKAIDYVIKRTKEMKFETFSKITQMARLEYYELCKQFLKERRQVLPCMAGVMSCEIYADGRIWSCAVRRGEMGSLRENNYDFAKTWFGEEAGKIRKSIKNRECACPLANASYTNMLCDSKKLLKIGLSVAK